MSSDLVLVHVANIQPTKVIGELLIIVLELAKDDGTIHLTASINEVHKGLLLALRAVFGRGFALFALLLGKERSKLLHIVVKTFQIL